METPLVGVVGGGQLGRMLALAGHPLGLRFRFLEPRPVCPAGDLGEVIHGDYDDPDALDAFRAGLTVATYEFENVPVRSVESMEASVPVLPPPRALRLAQDRLEEKEGLRRMGVRIPEFRRVDDRAGLDEAVGTLGLPSVLKTRRMGYDGKGQRVLRSPSDLDSAWAELGGVPLLLEAFVDFRRELSTICVRGHGGEVVHYPLTENEHRDGILRTSRAPACDVSQEIAREAERIGARITEELDYVGVLAVELFETESGLLVNEVAPRVHNSGHWTQDAAVTSQFENHLRAIVGYPLGSTKATGYGAMVNLIGSAPEPGPILRLPGAHLHLYAKEPRPGRKLGHVNLVGETVEEVDQALDDLARILS